MLLITLLWILSSTKIQPIKNEVGVEAPLFFLLSFVYIIPELSTTLYYTRSRRDYGMTDSLVW